MALPLEGSKEGAGTIRSTFYQSTQLQNVGLLYSRYDTEAIWRPSFHPVIKQKYGRAHERERILFLHEHDRTNRTCKTNSGNMAEIVGREQVGKLTYG